jgi:hypothetical protein
MTILRVEADLAPEKLLEAIDRLSTEEVAEILQRLLALKAQRTAPSLPQAESQLIDEINRGLPDEASARYQALMGQRREGTLTPEEYRELLRLSDQAEELEAARIRALSELARLRGTSLAEVMEELGIQAPADA